MKQISWWAKSNDNQWGPLSAGGLRDLVTAGIIPRDALIRREDLDKWVPVSKVRGLLDKAGFDSNRSIRVSIVDEALSQRLKMVCLPPIARLATDEEIKSGVGVRTNSTACSGIVSYLNLFSRQVFKEVKRCPYRYGVISGIIAVVLLYLTRYVNNNSITAMTTQFASSKVACPDTSATVALGDDAEEKAIEFVQKLGGKFIWDKNLQDKPVTEIDLSTIKITDIDLKQLASLKSLTKLVLNSTQVTDVGLKELVTLTNLSTLELSNIQITDAGLKDLGVLTNLTKLDLGFTRVTDVGMKKLSALKNLTTLDLSNNQITDAGLKELASLKKLTGLNLWGTRVSKAGVKEFGDLKLGCEIYGHNNAEDSAINYVLSQRGEIYRNKNLYGEPVIDVRLGFKNIGDLGLNKLLAFKNLLSLNVRCAASVTDNGLKELALHKNLTKLYLMHNSLTNEVEVLKELATLKNLSVLELVNTKVTDAGLKELTVLNSLTVLYLSQNYITDAGIKDLAGHKNLTELDLGHTQVTDAGLKDLTALQNLTKLDLSKTLVTDAGLKDLAVLQNLTKLELENIRITDTGMKELAELKNLTYLNLGNTQVTDAGMTELVKLKKLTYLNIGNTQVTAVGVRKLEKALSNCQISGKKG